MVSKSLLKNGTYTDIENDIFKIIAEYKRENIKFICVSEDFLTPVAELREKFNIIGVKGEVVELFRDKVKIKKS